MSLDTTIKKAAIASEGVYALRLLSPNIVDVGEGNSDPAKRRARNWFGLGADMKFDTYTCITIIFCAAIVAVIVISQFY